MAILEAKNVSIRYITGDFKDIGLKEYFMLKLKGQYHVKEFWADKDINFTLEKGDMLGIIGTNGAGKSTLLKAVSGIMRPTRGRMIINGTVAALLELASGFDGELTVRENTYLRGAMLGYTRKFMDAKYHEIINFAELEAFEDRPFKQLSSGMKSRLAFSIACLVQPDILILDEVLSVGDGAFQKKSAERMQAILKSGVTGILVSHSVTQVRRLCNKILWLDHGRQVGFSDEVELYCNAYEEFLKDRILPWGEKEIYAKGQLRFERAKLAEQKRIASEIKRKEALAKQQAEAERKKKETLAKQQAEAERKRKELLAKQQAEAERKKKETELLLQKRTAEQERRAAVKEVERLKQVEEQYRVFNLQDFFVHADKQSFFAEMASKYLDNCDYARIDIKNAGNSNNALVFESVSDERIKITSPAWYGKNGQGYVLDSNAGSLQISLRIVGDGRFRINLRGRDVRYTGDHRLPVWINYTYLKIDKQCIFQESQKVCHDAPYQYDVEVKDGQRIKISVAWERNLLN